MPSVEKETWKDFTGVVSGFLGNKKSSNFEDVVQTRLISFRALVCNMRVKAPFLHIHLVYFSENDSSISNEQGKILETVKTGYQD